MDAVPHACEFLEMRCGQHVFVCSVSYTNLCLQLVISSWVEAGDYFRATYCSLSPAL